MPTNKVKKERTKQGLSQFQLSLKSGVHTAVISKIENNVICPYPKWRKLLSGALNVPESELFPEVGTNANQ